MNRFFHDIKRRLILATLLCLGVIGAEALPLSHYASSSKLAKGRWRKIEVTETGMQLLTNAQLKSLGFNDPSKVNIYGYGGRRVSEVLSKSTYIDDLPQQPVVRTPEGIVFYGVNTIGWDIDGDMRAPYRARQNPYTTRSYYFVSDCEPGQEAVMTELACDPDPEITERTTVFPARLHHEKELFIPGNSGEWCLGEDFSQQNVQEFKFSLPGLASESASIVTGFGALTNETSSFGLSVNGKEIPEVASMTLPRDPKADFKDYLIYRVNTSHFDNASEETTVEVRYNPAKVVYFARLGYLTICYQRHLRLDKKPLIFTRGALYNRQCVYELSGADATTQIWDVTNPAAPARVLFRLEGDKALFSPNTTEYREYIAFNPSEATASPRIETNMVQNQDIHSVATPDMVIISPREYLEHARRIGELHDRMDGMDTYIVTPEALYNEFSSGAPDVSAYRKALKMWYDRDPKKLKYCLILGRPTYDQRLISDKVRNMGYPRPLTWQTRGEDEARADQSGLANPNNSYCTDDYIAMLEDNKGEVHLSSLKLNIAIGRMPFTSSRHATQMVDKLIKYVEQPETGIWRNRVTMIADNGDDFVHLKQTDSAYERLLGNGGEGFQYERIYLSGEQQTLTAKGKEYPNSKQRMMQMYDKGTSMVWYVGHANTREWTHENLFNFTDISSMKNHSLPVFYTPTCEFTRWDDDEISAGEILWSHTESGAIAMFTTTRSAFIQNNGYLNNYVGTVMYRRDSVGRALPIGEIARQAKNMANDDNRLRFCIIGDPAMRIMQPTMSVKVDRIGDIDPATLTSPDFPSFKGGGKITLSGSVMRGNNVARDFDGILHLTLYDAEQVLTTKDMDARKDSTQIQYNMSTNCVYEGRVKVEAGRWETEINVSTDIVNNYSPARLTMYAWNDDGQDANGVCDRFYLYGLEENVSDHTGPEITGLGLNTYNFKPGSQVGPNPVFYASFTDPSGINLSQAGIGHQMALGLDGKKFYTDVRDYYLPDADNNESGKVSYPLSDLEPGRHTLEFTVCDNFGNTTVKSLEFMVTASSKPILYEVTTDCNPASTSVTFTLAHDRLNEDTDCTVSVYDLSGRRIWTGTASSRIDLDNGATVSWNLCDGSGRRVPRGIYLYRATVQTSEGVSVSKTSKLAVTER